MISDVPVVLAATTTEWVRAGAVLGGGLVVAQALHLSLVLLASRGDSDPRGARTLGRLVRVVIASAALIYAVAQLGVRIGPLLTAAGIGGVALAFAVRTIFENFLAGILLLVRRPFRPGDQVATIEHEGTVEDVNLRAVVLRTPDGRRVLIPNGQVLGRPIVNLTAFPARRTELVVGVEYAADLETARTCIESAVQRAEGVLDRPPPEALVHAFGDSSVELCVRFWHAAPIEAMWRARHHAAVAAKRALEEAGIAMPFPQVTLRAPAEGPMAVRVESAEREGDV